MDINQEKRKREESGSPNSSTPSTQKKINVLNNPLPKTATKEIIKPIQYNILNYIERGRSASLSETPKKLVTIDTRNQNKTNTTTLPKPTFVKCTPSRSPWEKKIITL